MLEPYSPRLMPPKPKWVGMSADAATRWAENAPKSAIVAGSASMGASNIGNSDWTMPLTPDASAQWIKNMQDQQEKKDTPDDQYSGYVSASPETLAAISDRMLAAGMDVAAAQAQRAAGIKAANAERRSAVQANAYNAGVDYQAGMAQLGASGLGRSGLGAGQAYNVEANRVAANAVARKDAAAKKAALAEALRQAQVQMSMAQRDVANMRAREVSRFISGLGGN